LWLLVCLADAKQLPLTARLVPSLKINLKMDKKRLERIFVIHQKLRTMQGYTAKELLAVITEKTDQRVSDRTLRDDLQDLRDMGAEIPTRQKMYRYSEPFSIFEKFDDSYYGSLNEALGLLRQVAKNKEFVGLEDILLRLEQRISVTDAEKSTFIVFEEVELKGKEHLSKLHQHIIKKQFLQVNYKPFQSEAYQRHIFPVLLKEYNNRWFLICWENGKNDPQNLALDRIEALRETEVHFVYDKQFDVKQLFIDMIGVTLQGSLETVRLRFSENRFPFVATKKLHHSQQIDENQTVSIEVYTNRELTAKILEFGADVEVLEPESLREEISRILDNARTR
jgi:predicted DNA-binding transcriptional regulator YafY